MDTRTITFTFTDNHGTPLSSKKVAISSSTRIYDLTGHVVLEPVPISVTLDGTGSGSISLLCTDSSGITPTGFTYRLTPSWRNALPIDFYLPKGTGSVTLDQVGDVPHTIGEVVVVGPQGPTGPAGITVSSIAPSSPTVNQLWLQV